MINQDLRWVVPNPEEQEEAPVMFLQYSKWDVEKGGYVWINIPMVNKDGSPYAPDMGKDDPPPY